MEQQVVWMKELVTVMCCESYKVIGLGEKYSTKEGYKMFTKCMYSLHVEILFRGGQTTNPVTPGKNTTCAGYKFLFLP